MPSKKTNNSKTKSSSRGQNAPKTALKKKTIKKKAASKKTTRGKTITSKVAKKPPRVTAPSKEKILSLPIQETFVEPGPPPRETPPVEEPAAHETAVGTVSHYYSHLGVAVVQINAGTLKAGDTILFKGHTTDLKQTVESMEYEHSHIDRASAGQSVGIRVKDHVREHDIVYIVK